MKHCIAILLVCLLIAGTVSAISMNPGSLGVAKVSVTPTTHILVNSSAGYKVSAVATEEQRGMLEIYSNPSGAAVTLDGNSNPGDKTPIKYSLAAGTHTVVLSLSDYQDYTTTFNLDAGAIKDINAELKKKISASLVQGAALQTPVTIVSPGSGRSNPGLASQIGLVRTIEHVPNTLTIATTTTPTPWACPNNEWICLTPAEAGQQFGDTHARYGNEPCGYIQSGSETVARYCYMDVPSSGSLSPDVFRATGIREGDDIFVLNKTWIEHGVVNSSPALQKTGNADAGPLQPIFDFFSNLFGGSKKPESRLSIVGFAPQPEPPKVPLNEIAPEQGPEK